MSLIYEAIGRLVVFVVRKKFGRQIQIGAGIAAVAVAVAAAVAAYLLASRDVEEG